MREEYFMNYDFLRKQGEKVDQDGRSFRMLDFEDGGMYFGIVEGELPSGLGAFVYSDLKFHCGLYYNGLMNGLSRIHFGNGDVYDGEAASGQMEGHGFFFDCENNDWVFGNFEADNCIEVIEHGEGFPREEITKFRASLHQSAPQFYGRTAEPISLDLDLLIEYANRELPVFNLEKELSAKTPQRSMKASSINQGLKKDQDDKARKQRLQEFYEKALQSQEDLRSTKENMRKGSEVNKSLRKESMEEGSGKKSRKDKTFEMMMGGGTGEQERKKTPIPEVQMVSPQLLENTNPKTRKKGDKQQLKKTVGNQIIQDAYVVRPKNQRYFRDEIIHQAFDTRVIEKGNRMPEISNLSSVKDRDESRDIRNISIQTEDRQSESVAPHEDASLSYLKGIHSMIDELRHMMSDKLAGKDKTEELILSKIEEVKREFSERIDDRSRVLAELPHLTLHELPLDGEWNQTIDRQLEEQRRREIETALSQKFGAFEAMEVDENNIGEELEPIKESVDEEEEEMAQYRGSDVHAARAKLTRQVEYTEEPQWRNDSNPRELTIDYQKEYGQTDSNFFSEDIGTHSLRGETRKTEPRTHLDNFHNGITEDDEKEFYTEGTYWNRSEEKPAIGDGIYRVESGRDTVHLQYTPEVDRILKSEQIASNAVVNPINGLKPIRLPDQERSEGTLSFGPHNNQQLKIPLASPREDFSRESNFMYSRKGGESNNSAARLPGLASSLDRPRVQPWYFLNPYLYDVTEDVDLGTQ